MKFLREQLKDWLQYYFVPGVAALLPWTLAARWLRMWARYPRGPFNSAAQPAVSIAPQFMKIDDTAAFAARSRLIWLLDAVDFYLSVLRTRSWWPRHIERVGAWPTAGNFIATSFHHGTGLWVFRSLAQAGRTATLISARWDRSDFPGLPLRYWYGRMRGWDVERMSRRKVAVRPGVREKILDSLASGSAVVGVIDMPPRLAPRDQHAVHVIDRDISFPAGVLRLASEAKVPLVPYWVEFDLDTCERRFCIGEPLDPNDVETTLQKLADILDAQIRRTPEGWFFWPELPRWIEDARALNAVASSDDDAVV